MWCIISWWVVRWQCTGWQLAQTRSPCDTWACADDEYTYIQSLWDTKHRSSYTEAYNYALWIYHLGPRVLHTVLRYYVFVHICMSVYMYMYVYSGRDSSTHSVGMPQVLQDWDTAQNAAQSSTDDPHTLPYSNQWYTRTCSEWVQPCAQLNPVVLTTHIHCSTYTMHRATVIITTTQTTPGYRYTYARPLTIEQCGVWMATLPLQAARRQNSLQAKLCVHWLSPYLRLFW